MSLKKILSLVSESKSSQQYVDTNSLYGFVCQLHEKIDTAEVKPLDDEGRSAIYPRIDPNAGYCKYLEGTRYGNCEYGDLQMILRLTVNPIKPIYSYKHKYILVFKFAAKEFWFEVAKNRMLIEIAEEFHGKPLSIKTVTDRKIFTDFWDGSWAKKGSKTRDFYERFHRNIAAAISRFKLEFFHGSEITILDAGCGKGELLKRIDDSLCPEKAHFIGIDRSSSSVEACRQRNPGATVIEGDLLNLRGRMSEQPQPNCLIFSGILTWQVLSETEAYNIAGQGFDILSSSGICFVGGMATPYIEPRDFERMGFQIVYGSYEDPDMAMPLFCPGLDSCGVTVLRKDDNSIQRTVESICELNQKIPTELDLSCSSQTVQKAFIAKQCDFSRVETINLSYAQVSIDLLKKLSANMSKLITVNLSNTTITDNDLKELRRIFGDELELITDECPMLPKAPVSRYQELIRGLPERYYSLELDSSDDHHQILRRLNDEEVTVKTLSLLSLYIKNPSSLLQYGKLIKCLKEIQLSIVSIDTTTLAQLYELNCSLDIKIVPPSKHMFSIDNLRSLEVCLFHTLQNYYEQRGNRKFEFFIPATLQRAFACLAFEAQRKIKKATFNSILARNRDIDMIKFSHVIPIDTEVVAALRSQSKLQKLKLGDADVGNPFEKNYTEKVKGIIEELSVLTISTLDLTGSSLQRDLNLAVRLLCNNGQATNLGSSVKNIILGCAQDVKELIGLLQENGFSSSNITFSSHYEG